MIVVMKPSAKTREQEAVLTWARENGFSAEILKSDKPVLLCLRGDTAHLDPERLRCLDGVDSVRRLTEAAPLAARSEGREHTAVTVAGIRIGGGSFAVMAGPCSVESRDQIQALAKSVKAAGADVLRGGAFKPRTSPYSFQGLGAEGVALLTEAGKAAGLPVVSEIVSPRDLPLFEEVDLLQVGARNMQNYELLKELGHAGKPVLLKRGPGCTLKELLLSAEYLLAGGNERVILCERGIRSFDTAGRYTLDLAAVPILHEKSHLPVVVDPSHGTGCAVYVRPMALAAAAAGADGLLIEVHNDPTHALSDGGQSIRPEELKELTVRIKKLREIL